MQQAAGRSAEHTVGSQAPTTIVQTDRRTCQHAPELSLETFIPVLVPVLTPPPPNACHMPVTNLAWKPLATCAVQVAHGVDVCNRAGRWLWHYGGACDCHPSTQSRCTCNSMGVYMCLSSAREICT